MINQHLNILHLPRRVDRLQALLRQLEWQKIHYTIWAGLDNPNNPIEAIVLGHHRIVKYAQDNNLPNICLAEDDVQFTSKGAYNYFLSQIKPEHDLTFGLMYEGTKNENNRVTTGMSGVMTLYNINQKFYSEFLSQPTGNHIDRQLGQICHKYNFYVCDKYVCIQTGGYSDNKRETLYYDEYLVNQVKFNG